MRPLTVSLWAFQVKALRAACSSLVVQVDGGLSPSTTPVAAAAGANAIVSGSAVFKADVRACVRVWTD